MDVIGLREVEVVLTCEIYGRGVLGQSETGLRSFR